MSTDYKGTECLTGKLSMVGYYGGPQRGYCVQLTFDKPSDLYGEKHCNFSNDMGVWYLNMTKEQARELAVALFQFADGTREEEVE